MSWGLGRAFPILVLTLLVPYASDGQKSQSGSKHNGALTERRSLHYVIDFIIGQSASSNGILLDLCTIVDFAENEMAVPSIVAIAFHF